MVPMTVGEDDAVHASYVEAESLDVALEDLGIRSGVEQQGVRYVAAPSSDGAR